MNTKAGVKAGEVKLTPKQNAVIYCLQNGWELITGNDMKGAIVANRKFEYHIDNGIFWRLFRMGLIAQEPPHFCFTLTQLGKSIKTKPVKI